jgi:hypothetical protein
LYVLISTYMKNVKCLKLNICKNPDFLLTAVDVDCG